MVWLCCLLVYFIIFSHSFNSVASVILNQFPWSDYFVFPNIPHLHNVLVVVEHVSLRMASLSVTVIA
jgi:hypothetical protein